MDEEDGEDDDEESEDESSSDDEQVGEGENAGGEDARDAGGGEQEEEVENEESGDDDAETSEDDDEQMEANSDDGSGSSWGGALDNDSLDEMSVSEYVSAIEGHEGPLMSSPQGRREPPDVTVIVGGEEFHHYRQVLCLASEYFDVALNSGMKESDSMTFKFPDKCPQQWLMFAAFLEPRSIRSLCSPQLNSSNVETLIPWFHEFGVSSMLQECDMLYADMKMPQGFGDRDSPLGDVHNPKKMRRNMKLLLSEVLPMSERHDLRVSMNLAYLHAKRILNKSPDIFDLATVKQLVDFLKSRESAVGKLWSSVRGYLPEALTNAHKDPSSLLCQDALPHLILSGMVHHLTMLRVYSLPNRLGDDIDSPEKARMELRKTIIHLWQHIRYCGNPSG